jgi:RNA-splicing ligase RtcB
MIELTGRYTAAKIFTDTPDETTIAQIQQLIDHSFAANSKVRIMPDCHAGAGCVIGTTLMVGDKVVPNLVGVDIGCGVAVVRVEREIDLKRLDDFIREKIPFGFRNNETAQTHFDVSGLYCGASIRQADYDLALGSLGGGNHFIEVNHDTAGDLWLVVHSGSRNLGKQVADYYQHLAAELCPERLEIHRDLCYLTGAFKDHYLTDMRTVQGYATLNRVTMVRRIVTELLGVPLTGLVKFQTVHNYIDMQNILRKGAVSARAGEPFIVPINMRDGSLLCVGKGNYEWNQSAPHGAGRLMGRKEAKRKLNMEDFTASMEGIYTTSVTPDTLDESPMAYKAMEEIVANIEPTADITDVLKPVYNFKAGD